LKSFGQIKQAEDFGFRHLQTVFKGDTVDILIKSQKGDELKKKPLFLFCQGSLPVPLIITYNDSAKQGIYHVFVFNTDSLCKDYHLVIIGKPYIPLIVDQTKLNNDFTYSDSSKKFPKKYIERNLLDYYVDRNISVIKFLQTKPWILSKRLVVAGHSEGSTIAAKMASVYPGITQLIYSGGNPLGRILSIVERQRSHETDSSKSAEQVFIQWKNIVNDRTNMDDGKGDTYKATYDFSIPPIQYLRQLKIPVFVCYGTKDESSSYNDYLRVETIQKNKNNFTFKAYIGTEHNYFPLKSNGDVDYDIFNWDKVAEDWRKWLSKK
jgi:dienelactone hydrolase